MKSMAVSKIKLDALKKRIFCGRSVSQSTVTIDSGNTSNWQCGLLIANVNGAGNFIVGILFQGSGTGVINYLIKDGGEVISATIVSGKIQIGLTRTGLSLPKEYIAK